MGVNVHGIGNMMVEHMGWRKNARQLNKPTMNHGFLVAFLKREAFRVETSSHLVVLSLPPGKNEMLRAVLNPNWNGKQPLLETTCKPCLL